jgi:hypothetical protein
VVTNALETYARTMREEARHVQEFYDAMKDDPAKITIQDQSLITTNGLFQSARMFREAADSADRALAAYQKLTGDDE